MLVSRQDVSPTDDEIERQLRWANTDCVDPDAVDQADLLQMSRGPLDAVIKQSIEAHLLGCEYCSALSVEYGRIAGQERSRRQRRIAIAGLIAAAAAAALLFLLPPSPP